MNYFEILNGINVSDKTEKKNGLTYLSWAWAWGELKKKYPLSFYTVYENKDGWNYHTDGITCWVKTGVTVLDTDSVDVEHIEYLPIMDLRNKSIPASNVTSFDVNKAIQRSLTKAVARHGLGLYIYAGEDLPEDNKHDPQADVPESQKANPNEKVTKAHIDFIHSTLKAKNRELEGLLAYMESEYKIKISKLEDMTLSEFMIVKGVLEKKGK